MRLGLALAAWGAIATSAGGQSPAKVTFKFVRPGLETPRFTMAVSEDGRAVYHAELAAAGADATNVDRDLVLAASTVKKIFELARAADWFKVVCASKAKNIADTGAKTLTYTGPEAAGQCTFNYSEVKSVVALTDVFLSTEATLEAGRRLDLKRRFDRLGLDAEMLTLANMLESHQASGIETIVPTLRAIAGDTELLQRVRSRADKMLALADSTR